MTINTPQHLLNLKKYRKTGPKDKSRNPNPKTPTMMGEEKKTKFKERLTEMDLKKIQEMINKKKGGLSEGQKKIAAKAPPTNKIDGKDFAVLRAEKAKDRGMGLQDEKVKPGKVMKAKRGKAIEKLAKKKGLPVPLASSIPGGTKKVFFKAFGQFPAVTKSKSSQGTTAKSAMGKTFAGYSKVFKTGVSAGDKAKATSTIIGVKPKLPEASKVSKVARRALKGAQSTYLGRRLLPVVALGLAAQQYLKSKTKKKKEEPKKKMGGGMMKRPMGYKKGKEIDYGKIFDKKFYKSALGKEAQLHADDYDAGLDRAERRAASETMALMKKNKKMGGGMMKVPGYSIGSPKTPEQMRKLRGPQQAKKPKTGPAARAGRAGLGALGGSKKDVKPKMKVVIIGGSKNSLTGEGGLERDAENKPYRYSYSTDPMLKNATIIKSSSRMGGGMMNKPMGYKSGKSIKVKCKLGKNKPTKMY